MERDSATFRRKDEETLKQVAFIESQRDEAYARVAALEHSAADLTHELTALKQQNGEKHEETSTALNSARQRSDEDAAQCRKLEADLRHARSQIEAALQEAETESHKHASELAAAQDDRRRQ